jgi:hypothetical protein
MVSEPRKSATWNGRKSSSDDRRRCTSGASRMASRQSIRFVVMKSAPCASFAGSSRTPRSCSPPSAADLSRRTPSIALSSASVSVPASRLRLRAGQCRARYAGYPGLAWAPVNPAYGALYRADADALQGLLAVGNDRPAGSSAVGIGRRTSGTVLAVPTMPQAALRPPAAASALARRYPDQYARKRLVLSAIAANLSSG